MGVMVNQSQTNTARARRQHMTDAERHLWRALRMRQISGHRFRRQFPLGPYIVDFVCLASRRAIEVDGGQHSNNVHDAYRDAWLASQGFRVLRFWNNDVLGNLAGVVDAIDGAWHIPPPSRPSPFKGEGVSRLPGVAQQ